MAQQTTLSTIATPTLVYGSFAGKSEASVAQGVVSATITMTAPGPTVSAKVPGPTVTIKRPDPTVTVEV